MRNAMKNKSKRVSLIILLASAFLLASCGDSQADRGWKIPTDPQEKAAYDYAHSLKLPDSVPKPVPFNFTLARIKVLWPWSPSVSAQYFDHLCKTEAGEFIFKTVDKVEGIYQMRPRERATEDEFRDLYRMEDPYGYVRGETEVVAFMFIGTHRYRYFEQPVPGAFARKKDIYRHPSDERRHESLFVPPSETDLTAVFWSPEHDVNMLHKRYEGQRVSRYGFTWRGIKRDHDRELGVAGGELIVLDLETNELLGVRRGFAITSSRPDRTNWEFTSVCPRYEIRNRSKDFDFSYWFIRKVLQPVDPVEWPDVTF